ncbi:MAG: lipoate--protein ligase family protein [Treponema sp.]|jgi:lipoate-protein ligase A|nr:lipoate--protein ligase family protein [Treponema sp.]
MKAYPWRLLKTGFHNGFYNMALDEALLEAVARGNSPPVLRLYGWEPSAVSVGYFQGLEEEVDVGACKRRGVDVVRRISGGGAVFHQAELTYSIIMPVAHPLSGATIDGAYEHLSGGIIQALALLGVSSRFAPVNDILAGDRKISGNAQTRRMGCVLQHGTVLLDLDADLMFELLRVPSEKVKDKLIRDVKERVTGLKALLGRPVPYEAAEQALAEGFRRALALDYTSAEPRPEEEGRAQLLAAEKFAAPAWLYKR